MDGIKKGAGADVSANEWKYRGTTGAVSWDTFFSQQVENPE